MGHGLVPGTFRDLPLRLVPLRKAVGKKRINGDAAIVDLNLCVFYTEEEPSAVLGPVIEIGVIGNQLVLP